MSTEKSRPGEKAALPKVIAATGFSIPLSADLPAIFPRRRHAVSEFRRVRRDRAVFVAGTRRDGQRADITEDASASSFGLSEDELRRHARQLYRAGWSVDEIVAVLDVRVAA